MQINIFLISRVTSCSSSAQEAQWFKVMPKPRSSDDPPGFPITHLTFSYILSLFPATGVIGALLMPCPFPPQGLCSCRSLCLEHSSITYTNDSSLPSGLNSNLTSPGRPPLVRPPTMPRIMLQPYFSFLSFLTFISPLSSLSHSSASFSTTHTHTRTHTHTHTHTQSLDFL